MCKMREKRLIQSSIIGIGLLASGPALAMDHVGKIVSYQQDSSSLVKGACIQMDPPLPKISLAKGGRACLMRDNILYSEITDLLFNSYLYEKTCLISSDGRDLTGDVIIISVECSR